MLFNAFKLTPLSDVKVVILGQDPYHGPNQAHGLSFSVPYPTPPPPSLRNIFLALEHDFNMTVAKHHGDLSAWATQGVLMLNTSLSVASGQPQSHQGLGWQQFTDKVIEIIANLSQPVVFLLWGSHAAKKSCLVHANHHLVLKAPHPSPLSAYRGFITCKHFSKANDWLKQHNVCPIQWLNRPLPGVTPTESKSIHESLITPSIVATEPVTNT